MFHVNRNLKFRFANEIFMRFGVTDRNLNFQGIVLRMPTALDDVHLVRMREASTIDRPLLQLAGLSPDSAPQSLEIWEARRLDSKWKQLRSGEPV